jgi:hypothetical protein
VVGESESIHANASPEDDKKDAVMVSISNLRYTLNNVRVGATDSDQISLIFDNNITFFLDERCSADCEIGTGVVGVSLECQIDYSRSMLRHVIGREIVTITRPIEDKKLPLTCRIKRCYDTVASCRSSVFFLLSFSIPRRLTGFCQDFNLPSRVLHAHQGWCDDHFLLLSPNINSGLSLRQTPISARDAFSCSSIDSFYILLHTDRHLSPKDFAIEMFSHRLHARPRSDFIDLEMTLHSLPSLAAVVDPTTAHMSFDYTCLQGLDEETLYTPTDAFAAVCWSSAVYEPPCSPCSHNGFSKQQSAAPKRVVHVQQSSLDFGDDEGYYLPSPTVPGKPITVDLDAFVVRHAL